MLGNHFQGCFPDIFGRLLIELIVERHLDYTIKFSAVL